MTIRSHVDVLRLMRYAPRLAKDFEFKYSSCIAGSSEIIFPSLSYLFQQPQFGHRKLRGFFGIKFVSEQKKQGMVL